MKRFSLLLLFGMMQVVFSSGAPLFSEALTGAWQRTSGVETEQWLFVDGYCSYTLYNKAQKRFGHTMGGPFRVAGGRLEIDREFDSSDSGRVKKPISFAFAVAGNELAITRGGKPEKWQRLDKGDAPLAGNWHITQRMQDGQLQTIHQTGTRKTIKLLSGSRFQWIAIDPAVKGFYGTGGGGYTFEDGKYTEHIDFFSRDSSRVGASLSFNGKLNNDGWHHSGLGSRGGFIYEVWGRGR